MKQPATAYTIVEHDGGQLEIRIPYRKGWPLWLFLAFELWLSGCWVVAVGCMLGLLTGIVGGITSGGQWVGVLLVAVLFTYVGIQFIMSVVWQLTGVQVITVGGGRLILYNKGYIGAKPIAYDLSKISHFRVQDKHRPFQTNGSGKPLYLLDENPIGTLQFDYGEDTVNFADDLRVAEGYHVMATLQATGLLRSKQYWQSGR